jgi:hypothetical protein
MIATAIAAMNAQLLPKPPPVTRPTSHDTRMTMIP